MVLYPYDPDDDGHNPFRNSGGGGPVPPTGGITPVSGAAPTGLLPPSGGSGGSGGGGGGGSRPTFNFGDVPDFIPPVFQRPTLEDAMNAPGYQFRVQEGQRGLERSQAARGVLRTGGSLRDLTEYNSNFASNEYNNTYRQALEAFDRDYRGAYDAYAPNLAEWQFLSGAELQAGLAAFNRRGGGGSGGGGVPENPGPPPLPPEPPPFSWKPGQNTDPDLLDWERRYPTRGTV